MKQHRQEEYEYREVYDKVIPFLQKFLTLALENVFKTLDWDRKGIKVAGTYLNHLRGSQVELLDAD